MWRRFFARTATAPEVWRTLNPELLVRCVAAGSLIACLGLFCHYFHPFFLPFFFLFPATFSRGLTRSSVPETPAGDRSVRSVIEFYAVYCILYVATASYVEIEQKFQRNGEADRFA